MPARIASWRPFGLGHTKPHHYWEILRVLWENRDNLSYAWRILRHGVCDGCSLGPAGLRDNTMAGVHLCMVRLKLLRLNTMPAVDARRLENLASLGGLSNRELRRLGRLPYPMVRRRGERGFRRIRWEDALELAAEAIRTTAPERLAFYTTSRGLTNEVYYVAGKLARALGTNNVDNAARLCHAASTTAMKETLGVGAATCSYRDWIGTDLIVLLGSDIAANQPVATKYFYYAKEKGTRIAVVNPFREPGLESYWVPSIPKSALFGTRLADEFYPVRVGGDIAFLNGVLKVLIERGAIDERFIAAHTTGFEELKRKLAAQTWEELEAASGLPRAAMARLAESYARARTAVFIWSMGLTQHRFGVENVKAVVNLALARGMVGREKCGLVPIRGHSGVQGAAEVGSVPGQYVAGFAVNEENARRFAQLWGFEPPAGRGLDAPQMLEAAARGELDVLYSIGGNFLETMPEPGFIRAGFARLRLRVHQDIMLNSSMLLDSDAVLLLPARTRYEQAGGGTLTSTERRIRFSPEIRGARMGEARSEWEILVALAQRVLAEERRGALYYRTAGEIRQEMDRVIPLYKGIGRLAKEGDWVQYGGERLLEGGVCGGLPEGRARFSALDLPPVGGGDARFYLATRRGSQFNSMVFDAVDALTGAARTDVFMAAEDAAALGIGSGERLRLRSATGQMVGRARVVKPGGLARGCLVALWPEANVLVGRRYDPGSGEPDYNAEVTVERVVS
ncbi:MAG: FdhF/YdeP family oxidoreductase [Acidobacteria bacterium]|nr:FdhF/YdeP family oxidoreductase [Acidobacteriota bacterium]